MNQFSFFGKSANEILKARAFFEKYVDSIITETGVPGSKIKNIFQLVRTLGTESVHGFTHIMKIKDENRKGDMMILVKTERNSEDKYVVMGTAVSLKSKYPVIKGQPVLKSNSLVREYEVLKKLNFLADRTPNFPVALGLFNCFGATDSEGHLTANICSDAQNDDTNMTMMVTEYIHNANMLKEEQNLTGEQYFKIFLQIYFTLYIAYEYQKFTHYDLHFGNIMVRKINNTKLTYKLPFDTVSFSTDVLVYIIDFGGAYSQTIPPDMRVLTPPWLLEQYKINMNQSSPTVDVEKVLNNLMSFIPKFTPIQQKYVNEIASLLQYKNQFPWINTNQNSIDLLMPAKPTLRQTLSRAESKRSMDVDHDW